MESDGIRLLWPMDQNRTSLVVLTYNGPAPSDELSVHRSVIKVRTCVGSMSESTDDVHDTANLYSSTDSQVSTDKAIKWYLSQNATKSKMVVGMLFRIIKLGYSIFTYACRHPRIWSNLRKHSRAWATLQRGTLSMSFSRSLILTLVSGRT